MRTPIATPNRRILIVDDNTAIHDDFRKILGTPGGDEAELDEAEARIFGDHRAAGFEVDSAAQGADALKMLEQAQAEGRPYAMAFVDFHMPPGWNGAETSKHLWKVCPEMQIVICTAFSDTSWDTVLKGLNMQDRLLILKKPFDSIEALQLATALTEKWRLHQISQIQVDSLEAAVALRTQELEAAKHAALNMMEDAVEARVKTERALDGLKLEVTGRKQAEQRILEQAALLDKANDSIIVRSLEHRVMYWNHGAESIFGWSKDEVMGNSIRELFFPDPAPFDKAMQAVLQDGDWAGELEEQTKSNQAVILNSRWTLLRDDAGQPKSILTIDTDITERKQMERQLLRTDRLESIGTLAGGIAHDLNNALAPIMMSVELLRMEYPAESKMLDMIGSSAKRGADMVRQLLSFAKGAEGERVALQPGRLVKELENLMRGSFPKNIQLAVKSDPNLPMLIGDATQLHQVLLNLCVNARDAMPNGGTLTLEAQGVEVDAAYASSIPNAKPGNYLTLRVGDTGPGITPEILDRIFDPFFSTKGPDKGTGLGLSTVIAIVKGHRGFLQVYSQPGQGSMFTVYVPVHREGVETAFVPKTAVEFRGQGETIMLVDDEANVREIARPVLRRLNFNPLIATDGADGIIQAAEHRSKLRAVITDLHMPHMDGLAFVRALRRMVPDVPIIVASGQMEDAVAAEFKTLGVTSRLDKPFTEAQLAEALKNLLAPK